VTDACGPPVAGVILAAGRSERFAGRPSKLLAELAGETLVRRVVRAALGSCLRQVLVVVGHTAADVRQALAGLDVERHGEDVILRGYRERCLPDLYASVEP